MLACAHGLLGDQSACDACDESENLNGVGRCPV